MLNAQLATRGAEPAAIDKHSPEPKQTSNTKADTYQSAVDSFPNRPAEPGKAGERGEISITNAIFIRQVFRSVPENAAVALCHKANDPNQGGWTAKIYRSNPRADRDLHKRDSHNNYVSCSTFRTDSEKFCAKKVRFAACHFLLLDDLGTKVAMERLAGFELSWLIETSPGNHQGGIILEQPLTNGAVAEQLLSGVIAAGLCDAGASGPLNRWARLPVAINGKAKYADKNGAPFQCRLVQWQPDNRYTPQEIIEQLQLELARAGRPKKPSTPRSSNDDADDVLTPKAAENPVVAALKARGLYKKPLAPGKHDMTCPWVKEHTDQLDTGAAYFEPDNDFPKGGFCCQHSHRDENHLKELLEFLAVDSAAASHKPVIRVVAGELDRVVDAAEKELANSGRYYRYGGLISSIATDPTTRDAVILPTSALALTSELCRLVSWQKYDGRRKEWIRCDPPIRDCNVLFDNQNYKHLPVLNGLARQPYFRETDGELVMRAGYDESSGLFGVFDPVDYALGPTTIDSAQAALDLLLDLLSEFAFASDSDRSAALAGMLTAVVRPTLPAAPAFHTIASVFGSGKTHLCELIGAFAGAGTNEKMSYPTTSEEATKVILAILLKNPACVEFDDMDADWVPHGVIKRMLTADRITDRLLGFSKTASVSTRTLFLGSGNNVGPVRDLLRRVLTIRLDHGIESPATITYFADPLGMVRANRPKYVAAVLTIIRAWQQAGCPRSDVKDIVTYGAWARYCRFPLLWLGQPDPATALLTQISSDSDTDLLGELMSDWFAAYGEALVTIRRVVHDTSSTGYAALRESIESCPVLDKTGYGLLAINPGKLGWWLKRHAGRIVRGYCFKQGKADGRSAWQVIQHPNLGA